MPDIKELFIKGGPIMWPILICSIVALTVVVERVVFLLAEAARRQRKVVDAMLDAVEQGDPDGAVKVAAANSIALPLANTANGAAFLSALANELAFVGATGSCTFELSAAPVVGVATLQMQVRWSDASTNRHQSI